MKKTQVLGLVASVFLTAAATWADVGGGTVIVSNGFEGVESWTLSTTGTVGSVVTNILGTSNDNPTNQRIRSGTFSWQNRSAASGATGSNVLTFSSTDISGFSNRQVVIHVASISTNSGNGAEVADRVHYSVALNGAEFPPDPEIKLQGASGNNARWGFDATNFLLVAAGQTISNNAPQTGTSINNYANLGINLPNSATSVAVRIMAFNNDRSEVWCIDDVEVHADAPSWSAPPEDSPVVNITTANTNVLFATTTIDISGTNNVDTVGQLTWTNIQAGVSGTINAAPDWIITGVALVVGTNNIFVHGTNSTGLSSQDNVLVVRGEAPNQLPILSLSPTSTSYSVSSGATITFTVTGSQSGGDAGQDTTLTGLTIPSGASFGNTNGPAPVSSVFSWLTSATGIFSAVFVASDVDGAVTQAVDITVNPIPAAADGNLVVYDFTGDSLAPSALGSNLTASAFSVSDGRSITFPGGNPSPAVSATGWNVTNRYWEFSVTINGGYQASITNMSFNNQASATAATNWAIRTSLDGFAADIASGATTSSITASTQSVVLALSPVTGTITIRLYGENASSAAGTWRIDNVNLQGLTSSIGGGGDTTIDEYDVDALSLSGGTFSITISASSNSVPYTLIYTTNILTDPAPAGSGTADTENGNGSTLILQDVAPANPSRLYWIRSNN